jgi:NodT family efflux transporter outer membrane factor (OMF) lipoprotein
MMKQYVLLTITAILLTGCMVGPNFHSPTPPSAKTYTTTPLPEKTVSATTNSSSGQSQYFANGQDIPAQWWTMFQCPALNTLIQTGLNNSPNLNAAKATLQQAQETLRAQIGSVLFPSLDTSVGAQRQKVSAGTASGATEPGIFNLYNTSVNVSYALDLFGGARRGLEALESQLDYQRFQLEAAYLTLTSNIVTTAITSASLQAQIQATQQLIQEQQEQLTIVNKQYRLGGVSGADVLSQQSQLAQTRTSLPPLEQSLEKSQDALAVLVGKFPSEAALSVFNLDQLTLPTKLPISLPSKLVQQRPDVRASEALLHQASAQVGVAIANMLPQFNLTGGYSWSAGHSNNLFTANNAAWNIGGQLLQPLFHGGELKAKHRAAVDAYQAAAAQYQQTVLQAFQNVADTLQALQNDAQALQDQQQAESAARDSLAITQKQFRLGGVSYLALLNAQRQYQQTKISFIQAQAARFTDTAALFQALGGGWWNRSGELK